VYSADTHAHPLTDRFWLAAFLSLQLNERDPPFSPPVESFWDRGWVGSCSGAPLHSLSKQYRGGHHTLRSVFFQTLTPLASGDSIEPAYFLFPGPNPHLGPLSLPVFQERSVGEILTFSFCLRWILISRFDLVQGIIARFFQASLSFDGLGPPNLSSSPKGIILSVIHPVS